MRGPNPDPEGQERCCGGIDQAEDKGFRRVAHGLNRKAFRQQEVPKQSHDVLRKGEKKPNRFGS